MSWIELLICIFLLLIIIINFVAEPQLSMKYFGASIKSGKKIVVKCFEVSIDVIKMFQNKVSEKNATTAG